jgi:hypothetical protein
VVRKFITGVDTPVLQDEPVPKSYVDRYCPMAGRAMTYAGTDGTSGTGTAVATFARTGRSVHRVIGSAIAVRLEYLNWYTQPNTPGEVNNPNSVTYRAAIEYPAGKLRQISGSTAWSSTTSYSALDQVTYYGASYVALQATTIATVPTAALGTEWQLVTRYAVRFAGGDVNNRVTVAAGGQAISLPLLLSITEGQYMAVTTTVVTANAANAFSADITGTGSGWDFAQDYPSAAPAVGTVDLVDIDATIQTNMGAGTRIPMPSAILGLARQPEASRSVALIGDSLLMGYLDTPIDGHLKGFAVRGPEYEDVRYRRVQQGGDRMAFWTAANATKRIALVQPATTVFCDLGSNDLANGATLAQLQAAALVTWTQLGAQGAKVHQWTLLPKTTSTDSWATKANQTPVAPAFAAGGTRQLFNAWLRAGASTVINGNTVTFGQSGHPLTGVVDISATVEDATDSNYWKTPGWTTDGAHPTATGYEALGQAFRQYQSTMLIGNALKHAALHAASGPDPITPVSIGAADAATLGGFLNALSGYGTFADYLFRGEIASSHPSHVGTVGTQAFAVTTARSMLVLLGYAVNQAIADLEFIVSTAMVAGTALMNIYTGTVATALTKIASDVTVTTQLSSTGLKTVPIAGTAQGYIAALICLTGVPTTYPVVKAITPLDSGLLVAPSGVNLAGISGATALPTTLTLTSGWGTPGSKPWMAARAF